MSERHHVPLPTDDRPRDRTRGHHAFPEPSPDPPDRGDPPPVRRRPWPEQFHGARDAPWPALPDDSPLWRDAVVGPDGADGPDRESADHLHRLDQEQRGRPWNA